MCDKVLVTGMGVLTSAGRGIEGFSDCLRSGRVGITSCVEDGLGVVGRLQGFDFESWLAELSLPELIHQRALRAGRRAPRSAQVSLITALEAWHQAFGGSEIYQPEEINILVAGNNINQAYQRGMMEKFQNDPEFVPASYALHFMDTDQVGILSEVMGIRGEGYTVGGASASGNVAILQAYRQVKYGLCKACVVVGAMADLSPVELRAFQHAGALGGKRFAEEPEKACRPFDADRDGFIYGQGSACLILESGKRALDRDATIWGRIAGGAACLDGNRSSDPSVAGEVRVMKQALEEAGRTAEEVQYVNAHATSSRLGDEVEVKAIKEMFGPHLENVSVNATKGLIGHCLYAAGVVEVVATLLQMKGGFLHPNVNLENPIDDDCRFIGLTAEMKQTGLSLSNAFGFGGINTSIVIENYPPGKF
jgi:malonyl-ACP decarboxylase